MSVCGILIKNPLIWYLVGLCRVKIEESKGMFLKGYFQVSTKFTFTHAR